VVFLTGLVLAMAGCGDEGETPPAGSGGPDEALRGRTFLSTAVTENGRPRALVKGTRISFWFADDGRLVANAGCNSMQGPVSTADGRLKAADLSMTGIGCNAALHAQDDWLAKLLGGTPSWQLQQDTLTVTSGTTTLTLLDRKVAEPDLPLEGTTWKLSSVIDGEVASHQAAGEKAYLRFSDGKVSGSTGCNDLSGPATVAGDKITFGAIATTRRGCPNDIATVEDAVLRVLRGSVTFKIESSTLSLRHPNAHGLDLTGAQR